MKRTLDAALFDHPASVGETYPEHFLFASRFGLKLIGAGLAKAMVKRLIAAGYDDSHTLRGGLNGWQKAGNEVATE